MRIADSGSVGAGIARARSELLESETKFFAARENDLECGTLDGGDDGGSVSAFSEEL